jgi:2-methylcitrate dehydratase (2-methyl-trans-aconitate forming)
MNQHQFLTNLPGMSLKHFDTEAAVNEISAGAWRTLSYTAKVHAENLLRKCEPSVLRECLEQIVFSKRERDFPWFPARVVCHDILGQTALVDLAGLRDAIADQGGDPAKVNPVVPWLLSAVALTQMRLLRTARLKIVAMKIGFTLLIGPNSRLRM